MSKKRWRVGSFLDPQPDDLQFDDMVEACDAAYEMAKADHTNPIVVWTPNDQEHMLIYGLVVWFPAHCSMAEMFCEVEIFPYSWAWAKWPTDTCRKGQFCRVVVRSRRMNSCLLEFEDGYRVVTSRNGLRKRKGWS